ncbi:MAG: serine/threonine-protein kinase [Isosphaeraceae bacterium]
MTAPRFEDQDARDEHLARLLGELIDAEGGPAELDALTSAHPELAEDIRALWAALQVVEEMGRGSSAVPDTIALPFRGRPATEPSLGHAGRFTLLEELGRGGMGVVYRAWDEELGRMVAVKRLLHRAEPNSPAHARFLGDAYAGVHLDHPNIVPVYQVDEDQAGPFIVMRLIEGTNLARRLGDGPLPQRDAARLLVTVARAVACMHERNILHRDLKPSNVLLDSGGYPYVCDFGLAKQLDLSMSLTGSGTTLGTPGYMSPEQASPRTGEVSTRSDVYGLGAVLYHALTGRPPFQAASACDTMMLVVEQDPIPPRLLDPTIAPDLEMITLKCLQKRPELRYASAAEVAADLEAFLDGEPVRARSATLRAISSRLLGETHHAHVLENWGRLWMAHSVALIVFFLGTDVMRRGGIATPWPYLAVFTAGLGSWAALFWWLRRRGGPIRFVERQMAHIWAAGMAGINLTFLAEWWLGLPVLTLAPLMAVEAGMLFLAKAGVLSGEFYVYAAAEFLAVWPMAHWPQIALPLYGLVSAACFFATGWKYHRRRLGSFGQTPGDSLRSAGPPAAQ